MLGGEYNWKTKCLNEVIIPGAVHYAMYLIFKNQNILLPKKYHLDGGTTLDKLKYFEFIDHLKDQPMRYTILLITVINANVLQGKTNEYVCKMASIDPNYSKFWNKKINTMALNCLKSNLGEDVFQKHFPRNPTHGDVIKYTFYSMFFTGLYIAKNKSQNKSISFPEYFEDKTIEQIKDECDKCLKDNMFSHHICSMILHTDAETGHAQSFNEILEREKKIKAPLSLPQSLAAKQQYTLKADSSKWAAASPTLDGGDYVVDRSPHTEIGGEEKDTRDMFNTHFSFLFAAGTNGAPLLPAGWRKATTKTLNSTMPRFFTNLTKHGATPGGGKKELNRNIVQSGGNDEDAKNIKNIVRLFYALTKFAGDTGHFIELIEELEAIIQIFNQYDIKHKDYSFKFTFAVAEQPLFSRMASFFANLKSLSEMDDDDLSEEIKSKYKKMASLVELIFPAVGVVINSMNITDNTDTAAVTWFKKYNKLIKDQRGGTVVAPMSNTIQKNFKNIEFMNGQKFPFSARNEATSDEDAIKVLPLKKVMANDGVPESEAATAATDQRGRFNKIKHLFLRLDFTQDAEPDQLFFSKIKAQLLKYKYPIIKYCSSVALKQSFGPAKADEALLGIFKKTTQKIFDSVEQKMKSAVDGKKFSKSIWDADNFDYELLLYISIFNFVPDEAPVTAGGNQEVAVKNYESEYKKAETLLVACLQYNKIQYDFSKSINSNKLSYVEEFKSLKKLKGMFTPHIMVDVLKRAKYRRPVRDWRGKSLLPNILPVIPGYSSKHDLKLFDYVSDICVLLEEIDKDLEENNKIESFFGDESTLRGAT